MMLIRFIAYFLEAVQRDAYLYFCPVQSSDVELGRVRHYILPRMGKGKGSRQLLV